LLKEQGIDSNLLAYLSKQRTDVAKYSNRKKMVVEDEPLQSLSQLKKNAPEKYTLLSEFESLLKKGAVLSNLNELREFVEKVNTQSLAKSSRKNIINKLIIFLTDFNIQEIKNILKTASSSSSKDSGYQQLSNYIITGGTTKENKIEAIADIPCEEQADSSETTSK